MWIRIGIWNVFDPGAGIRDGSGIEEIQIRDPEETSRIRNTVAV
jgi:hypothetical protein